MGRGPPVGRRVLPPGTRKDEPLLRLSSRGGFHSPSESEEATLSQPFQLLRLLWALAFIISSCFFFRLSGVLWPWRALTKRAVAYTRLRIRRWIRLPSAAMLFLVNVVVVMMMIINCNECVVLGLFNYKSVVHLRSQRKLISGGTCAHIRNVQCVH